MSSMLSEVYAKRFSLPRAPDGELAEFAVLSVEADARGTTYTLVEADTLRFTHEGQQKS